ncbi:hypothetical protein P7C70_g6268, partial [Phenoliferia sp. Uapishka_3]
MALSLPTSQRYTSFNTATAFLELCTTQGFVEHTVPTETLASDTPERPPFLAQSDDHALHSTTFFNPNDRSSFVLSRIIDDGYALELSNVSYTAGPSSSATATSSAKGHQQRTRTLPPVRFSFPSRLIPNPAFSILDNGDLQVHALTDEGYLYVLWFSGQTWFNEPALEDEVWSAEFKVEGLEGKVPVGLWAVDERRVVVAAEDGSAFVVQVDDQLRGIDETTLKPSSSSFPFRLPSFSTRNLSTLSSNSSPTQLISLATSPHSSFAIGVTRDRKLKLWSLETGHCLKSIDLPKPTSAQQLALSSTDSPPSTSKVNQSHSLLLLPPTLQPIIKVIRGDDDSLYLVLFSSPGSSFVIYSISLDASGSVNELNQIGERISVGTSTKSLVDFDVVKFTSAGNDSTAWTLWALWEEGGTSEVRFVGVPELNSEETEGDDEVQQQWTIVESASIGSEWNAGYFDDLLQDDESNDGGSEVCLEHIFYPGRYTPATLEYALEVYTISLEELTDPTNRPEEMNYEYDSIRDRVIGLVGCSVVLEESVTTGAPLQALYNKKRKEEWMRFIAIANESRAAAMFPVGLGVDGRGEAVVLMRAAMGVPVVQDPVLLLQRLTNATSTLVARTTFQALPPASLESTYPHLAPRAIRQDIFIILSCITALSNALSPPTSRKLESTILETVRTPLSAHVSAVAIGLYEDFLGPHVDEVLSAFLITNLKELGNAESSLRGIWECLTTDQIVGDPSLGGASGTGSGKASELAKVLLADLATCSIEARFNLVKGLMTLLLFINGEDGAEGLVEGLDSITSGTLATFHTMGSLRWVVRQEQVPRSGKVKPLSEYNLEERLGSMHVAGDDEDDLDADSKVTPFSLLSGLLSLPQFSPSIPHSTSLPHSLPTALSKFLSLTKLIQQKRLVIDSEKDVEFAMMLQEVGLSELCLEFVGFYPQGCGMEYVKGLAWLGTGRGESEEEAGEAFRKAAGALYEDIVRLDEESGISVILPPNIAGSLARYYYRVTELFIERNLDQAVVTFASLALEASAEEGIEETQELWEMLFVAQIDLGMFEDAYVTLMGIPYPAAKIKCMAQLVSAVCENGQTGLLTQWSFVGLQSQLQRLLSQRANGADPLASPNYYKVLYAYYISKGDYRSAGAIMFQQGRRIGKIQAHDLPGQFELATLQCQSYLAAANALSLVAKEHAWVTVGEEDSATGEPDSKRRRIAYCIPDSVVRRSLEAAFKDPDTSHVEVVELADIRREYAAVLSRLELSEFDDYGGVGAGNITVDASVTVKGFSIRGAFESALSTAYALDVDMSDIFEKLTESCVALSRSSTGLPSSVVDWVALSDEAMSWEGTLASKAWRLLERYLERYDDENLKYRLVVLEHTLAVNGRGKLPTWLVSTFLAQDSQLLIRTMLKFDRLADAFTFSLAVIQSSPKPSAPAACILPYSLFDQLLAILPDDTSALSSEALKSRQADLSEALRQRLAVVERADRAIFAKSTWG